MWGGGTERERVRFILMPDMLHKGHTAEFSAEEKEEKENEAREGGGEREGECDNHDTP